MRMWSKEFFVEYARHRNAELIQPPNMLKRKVGSGGLDEMVLMRAEEFITQSTKDFEPVAEMYFSLLETNVQKILNKEIGNEEDAFELILYPLVQLKSQGRMFRYPLVTDISGMLINFLEVIETLDKDAIDLILAHKMTLKAVLSSGLQNQESQEGDALVKALKDACMRYFQTHSTEPTV